VGAFDGELGSNTYFFEKRLGWTAWRSSPTRPSSRRCARSGRARRFRAAPTARDGEVSFLALSGGKESKRSALRPPNLSSMIVDPSHGAEMLSGIQNTSTKHAARGADDGRLEPRPGAGHRTVPPDRHRISKAAGVGTVDYLSIDVEGAELQVLHGSISTRSR
jgi:hypothetical protein